MIVLKQGSKKPLKFVCKYCGCEFVAEVGEYNTYTNNGSVSYCYAYCPNCVTEVVDSEPWEDKK